MLTNVQEELDRMTRKPDSMVTNSSTENEAWSSLKSAYVKWPNNYVYWSALRPGFFWYGTCYQFFGAGEMNLKKKNTSLACLSVKCTFRKVMCQTPLWRITLGLSGMWLSLWAASSAGLLEARKMDGEKEGPLPLRMEQMRPGSHWWWLVWPVAC